MDRPLTIRSAVLIGYSTLARSVGLDPARMAKQAGVSLAALTAPDAIVPARSAYRLLELSASESGVEDFGLRLAQQRGLSHLGALGLVSRDEPDVRSALGRIASGLNLHSTCTRLDVQVGGDVAILALTLLADGEAVIRQATETAVSQLFQDLVALQDRRWRPLNVQFIHAAGTNTRSHRAMFGCPVAFSGEQNAIIMRSSDLDRPVSGADPGFRTYADALASRLAPVEDKNSVAPTKQAIASLLPKGTCTSRAVAQLMGIDRRTLQRRLGEADTDFSAILFSMRMELAEQYLRAGSLSMADISTLLGFNSPRSFSRWFSERYGCTPTRWRTQEGSPMATSAMSPRS
jgi:AraC-like DNA-binding protein